MKASARGQTPAGHVEATAAAGLFAGPGEVRALCRRLNWGATPLGPVEYWPQSLRTAAGLVLGAAFPMILLWGPELVQLYNDGYREIMGAKHPGGLGQRTLECWPEVWPINEPIYARVRAGETVWREEALYPLRRRGPDASPDDVYITISYSPVPDETGGIGGVLVTLLDVTAQVTGRAAEAERARLAAALDAERTALLEEVFRQAPSFLHVLRRPEFVVELANEAYYRLVGRRDLIGRPAFEAMPEAAAGGFPERIVRVMATREPFVGRELPVTLARTPGTPPEERLIDLVYLPLVDADGTCTRVLGHGTDVTEHVHARWRAEDARRASERWLATALGAARMGTFDWDPAEDRLTLTEESAEVFGLLPGTTLSTTAQAFAIIHPDDVARHRATFLGAARRGEEYHSEYRVIRPRDGEVAWIEERGSVVIDPTAEVLRVRGVHWDVSERVRARHALEAASRAKSEFLAVMSHELRTPLNAIGGYAQLIELGIHGPVTPEQRHALDRIQRGQQHLLGLINAVLNYAKLEGGHVEYRATDVPVGEALAEVTALVAPQAHAKGLTLLTEACAPGLVAHADPEKLRQVLLNLLSNAIKFTRGGGMITLGCDGTPDGRVAVRVADTGRGIAADHLKRVFQPFVQVDATLTRTEEGAGLGLAISRDLARGMGGDLTVESTPGVGSTFTLTLPAAGESSRCGRNSCRTRDHASVR
jgi:PAS domain S-box-containing protein